ncbi:MAG TPA: hypothetical protein VLL49_08310, partial [Anaerolineales bacterium]|nr:hypothetical protein [Anaerolineales bacterium]
CWVASKAGTLMTFHDTKANLPWWRGLLAASFHDTGCGTCTCVGVYDASQHGPRQGAGKSVLDHVDVRLPALISRISGGKRALVITRALIFTATDSHANHKNGRPWLFL